MNTGTFSVRPFRQVQDYDTIKIRLRLAKDSGFILDGLIAHAVGEEGVIYFKSQTHPGIVHSYPVYKWLSTDNRSVPSLVKEVNAVFLNYFLTEQNWSHEQCSEIMPKLIVSARGSVRIQPGQGCPSSEVVTQMALTIGLDPNMAQLLRGLGFDFVNVKEGNFMDEASQHRLRWWKTKAAYHKANMIHFVSFSPPFDWSGFMAHARFPITESFLGLPLGRYFYWVDETIQSSKLKSVTNDSAFINGDKHAAESHVVAKVKEIFSHWIIKGYFKSVEVKYEANDYIPSIRQLRITILCVDQDMKWEKMRLTFSPDLVYLFGWNPNLLELGDTMRVIYPKAGSNPTKSIKLSMRKFLPPEPHGLNILADVSTPMLVRSSENPSQLVIPPRVDDCTIVFFYDKFTSLSGGVQIVDQSSDKTIFLNVCPHRKTVFHHSVEQSMVLSNIVLKFDVHDCTLISSNSSLTLSTNQVGNMLSEIKLKLGSYVIDSCTNNCFAIRNFILSKLFDGGDSKRVTNSTLLSEGSKSQTILICPFKYQTAPHSHLFSSLPVELSITYADANSFVTVDHGATDPHSLLYKNRISSPSISIPGAKLNARICKTIENITTHGRLSYDYTQWTIAKTRITRETMEVTSTAPFFKRTQAKRFVVAMSRANADLGQLPQFESLDVLSMELKEGTKTIGEHVCPEADYSALYQRYLKHAQSGNATNLPSLEQFSTNLTIFIFDREEQAEVTNKEDPEQDDDGLIRLGIVFKTKLPCDIDVYCLAETPARFEIDYSTGQVVSTTLLEGEQYKCCSVSPIPPLQLQPRHKVYKENGK